jgi:predicted nuclease of predicted toxin-antitoxin system
MGAGRVKLLLDENLSRRIVPSLQTAFPGTTQVALVGLEQADDRAIWEYAKAAGYVLVTKDDDFAGLLSVLGYPPKVVRLAMGNCSNQSVIDALVKSKAEIEAALANPDIGLVEVY